MARLILVVPCYNEADRLDPRSFLASPSPADPVHFLFVNDGSGDDTLQRLHAMHDAAPERVDVLDLQPNRGKGEAVRLGLLQALTSGPQYVGYWDADLATPLDAVADFVAILGDRPAVHLVCGARVKLLGRTIERRAWRHYAGRVFATAVSLMLRLPIYDTQCGAKVLRATDTLGAVLAEPFVSRWLFDVELLARLLGAWRASGIAAEEAIHELPLTAWRDVGGSKLVGSAYVRAALSLARVWLATRRDRGGRRASSS